MLKNLFLSHSFLALLMISLPVGLKASYIKKELISQFDKEDIFIRPPPVLPKSEYIEEELIFQFDKEDIFIRPCTPPVFFKCNYYLPRISPGLSAYNTSNPQQNSLSSDALKEDIELYDFSIFNEKK